MCPHARAPPWVAEEGVSPTIQLNAAWGHGYTRAAPSAHELQAVVVRSRRHRSRRPCRRRVGRGVLTMASVVLKRLCGYAGVRIGQASNPGPNPGAGDCSASGSGAVEASSPTKLRTRRRLECVKYDEVRYGGDSLALHDSSAKVLQNAARQPYHVSNR